MSLDGLRAWIGEVERKLGVRTKVMLALAAIAIGIGGAAMYLAIDTRESAVSEKDVQELQGELESRIGTGGATGTGITQLESELKALQSEVDQLRGEGGSSGQGRGDSGGGAGTGPGGAGTGETGGATDRLRELREQAKEASE
ncbi:MAG TPA: hypothetical protein VFZ41_11280 [Solirubrobacterales bacterium]